MRTSLMLLLALSACGKTDTPAEPGDTTDADEETVISLIGPWIANPAPARVEAEGSCTENLLGAECPEEEEPEESPWTRESENTITAERFTFEVYGTDGDTVYGAVGGYLAEGTLVDGTLTLKWEEVETDTDTVENTEDPYTYQNIQEEGEERSLTLTLGEDGSWSGTVKETYFESESWTESDVWSFALSGDIGSNGDIPSGSFLDSVDGGSTTNGYDDDDCEGATCELELEYSETVTWRITAVPVTTALESNWQSMPSWPDGRRRIGIIDR